MTIDTGQTRGGALLLRGGTVIDGTGAAALSLPTCASTATASRRSARRCRLPMPTVIDASGLVVAPGFIDVHTHDDQIVLAAPTMLPKISQGVTTVVVGNCGISLAPLVHANVPPPLNLLGGSDKYVHPTMAAYARGRRRARGPR